MASTCSCGASHPGAVYLRRSHTRCPVPVSAQTAPQTEALSSTAPSRSHALRLALDRRSECIDDIKTDIQGIGKSLARLAPPQ